MFEHECKYSVLYRSWNSSGKAWVGTPVGSHRYQNTIKIGTKYFPIGHAHILKVKSLKVQPDGVKGRKVCGTIYGDIHYKTFKVTDSYFYQTNTALYPVKSESSPTTADDS